MSLRFYASAPIYDAGGAMVGRLCVFDTAPKTLTPFQLRALTTLAGSVTDMIELRQRRTREVEEASAEDEMARIAAEISHDMRVPLASIVANVEMVTDELVGKVEPTAELMLARTERNANRLLRMVDALMQFHEVGSGQSFRPVDLQAVLDQVLASLNPQLDDVRARIRVRGLPVVRADVDQLYSVLQNLVSNAVKFARPDVPLEILVSAVKRGDCWRISVSDNGVGVPDTHRHEVFSMFSRVGHRVEGHGIGLATVRRIVHAHGGSVGMDDGTAGGVAVWFELPA
jgi:signal transduction histidine kinase